MTSWVWIDKSVVLAIHNEQLAEHGGATGIRDEGLLDSALARPLNKATYGDTDITALASAYGYGLIRNHPFIDGNKRIALVTTELFLVLNGYELTATDADCLQIFLLLADGTLTEEEFALWLASNNRRI